MTGDDHIALAGALVLAFLAIREARRYFRTLPDYCVTPLGPEVRPELLPCAARCSPLPFVCTLGIGHPGEHVAHGTGYRVIHRWADHCDDSTGALFDALNAQGRALTAAFASTLAEIRSLPERETSA